jgi:hypothetical protein
VDQKIRGIVSLLNFRGIRTTGSCEGHITHGAPAPWVKVTPPKARSASVLRKTSRYLNAFYAQRTVRDDVRLVIQKANSGFWIHNGGDGYNRWRTFVNENVAKIRGGEKVKTYIDSKERARRSKKLPIYQEEIKAFAEFMRPQVRRK